VKLGRGYSATVRLFESIWCYEWFGFPRRRIIHCEIEIPGGIPIPGKGENAWDCGEDAALSMTTPVNTIPEVIGQLVAYVPHVRER
jgi:hypothetical protein